MADMIRPVAPPNIPSLVQAAFNKARVTGDVTYYPTQVAVLTPRSIPVSIPVSIALVVSAFKTMYTNILQFNSVPASFLSSFGA